MQEEQDSTPSPDESINPGMSQDIETPQDDTPATPTQPDPINQGDNAPPAQPTPVRRRRRALIIVAIIFALLAGAITAYFFLRPSSREDTADQSEQATTQTTSTSETVTIDAVSATTATGVVDQLSPLFPASTKSSETGTGIPIKVAGYEYWSTFYAQDAGDNRIAGFRDETAADVTSTKMSATGNALRKGGFSEVIIQPQSDDAMYIAYYYSDNVVCNVSNTPTANAPKEARTTQVVCSDMSGYVDNAKAAKPFYDVYIAANPDVKNILLGSVTIANSKTTGYKTAELAVSGVSIQDGVAQQGIGGAAGLFYQTPDEKWHYFTSTQSILGCSEYSNADLKKAYAGTGCYDETTKSDDGIVTAQ